MAFVNALMMGVEKRLRLKCKECGSETAAEAVYACDHCLGPLEVAYDRPWLDAEFARRRITDGTGGDGIWRYADFLPVDHPPPGALEPGMSPMIYAKRLGEALGLKNLWIKNEASNPTHSFKDRVVAVAVARAVELGFDKLACASTGNLAHAVAAASAAIGKEAVVFVPTGLEEQKMIATGVYGARMISVRGSYDDVNRLCVELAVERDWAFVNINLRPYYSEGSKTLAYETVEQLGWRSPDRVICPIASGSLFTRLARGFDEWREIGLIEDELPIFNGAQASGCAPVANAFAEGADVCRPVHPDTIAKSLAIGDPADGPYALDLARRSGGSIESVTDDEIRAGIRSLAETTGIFTETAGGVTIAVLRKLAERGDIEPDETVVAYVTGDGLKTLDAIGGSTSADEIHPDLRSVESLSL